MLCAYSACYFTCIIILNPNFPKEHHIFKHNSACTHTTLTISTQLFDPTPFRVSIVTYYVNTAYTLHLFRPLFHIYNAFEPHIFQPEHHFSKHNSAYTHPSSTNSIQLFDPTPFSMSIWTYLVNIACTLLLLCMLLHIYFAFEPHFLTGPSLFFSNIIGHTCTPRRPIEYSYCIRHHFACPYQRILWI